jgi:hypothetical protein
LLGIFEQLGQDGGGGRTKGDIVYLNIPHDVVVE